VLRRLKHHPDGTVRIVPIPPVLVTLLRQLLNEHGTTPEGRLFTGTRGSVLSESLYGRTWHAARAGNSVQVPQSVYTHCVDGQSDVVSDQIEHALHQDSPRRCGWEARAKVQGTQREGDDARGGAVQDRG
jgi:hypothetical protein